MADEPGRRLRAARTRTDSCHFFSSLASASSAAPPARLLAPNLVPPRGVAAGSGGAPGGSSRSHLGPRSICLTPLSCSKSVSSVLAFTSPLPMMACFVSCTASIAMALSSMCIEKSSKRSCSYVESTVPAHSPAAEPSRLAVPRRTPLSETPPPPPLTSAYSASSTRTCRCTACRTMDIFSRRSMAQSALSEPSGSSASRILAWRGWLGSSSPFHAARNAEKIAASACTSICDVETTREGPAEIGAAIPAMVATCPTNSSRSGLSATRHTSISASTSLRLSPPRVASGSVAESPPCSSSECVGTSRGDRT